MGDRSMADVKAELAQLGVSLDPKAALLSYERPAGLAAVVMVERVVDGPPSYCVHGFASCLRCDELCYLGSETSRAVVDGKVFPLCIPCANVTELEGPSRRIDDH